MANEFPVGNNMTIGAGELYFDRFDATTGARTGERCVGNAEALAIAITPEVKKKYSSMAAARNLAAQAVIRLDGEVTFTLSEATKANLALMLFGIEAGYTQLGTAITAEAINGIALGVWFSLANRKVSAVVVKKGATTYVLNTDYALDAETGRIKPLSTGTMVAGDNITVDYSRTVITGPGLDQVNIGAASKIEGKIRFVPDPTAGVAWDVILWRVNLTPEGKLDFIADDYGTFQLKGTLLDDSANHPTQPLGVAIKRN